MTNEAELIEPDPKVAKKWEDLTSKQARPYGFLNRSTEFWQNFADK